MNAKELVEHAKETFGGYWAFDYTSHQYHFCVIVVSATQDEIQKYAKVTGRGFHGVSFGTVGVNLEFEK